MENNRPRAFKTLTTCRHFARAPPVPIPALILLYLSIIFRGFRVPLVRERNAKMADWSIRSPFAAVRCQCCCWLARWAHVECRVARALPAVKRKKFFSFFFFQIDCEIKTNAYVFSQFILKRIGAFATMVVLSNSRVFQHIIVIVRDYWYKVIAKPILLLDFLHRETLIDVTPCVNDDVIEQHPATCSAIPSAVPLWLFVYLFICQDAESSRLALHAG